jgi:5-methylcytosine-specific restriction endonuclease McrA
MTPNPKPKTIRLKGAAYKELRRQAWKRAGGFCERCGRCASLYNPNGDFDLWICGHLSHIKSRGAGGSDTLGNVEWLCPKCHLQDEHGLKWTAQ